MVPVQVRVFGLGWVASHKLTLDLNLSPHTQTLFTLNPPQNPKNNHQRKESATDIKTHGGNRTGALRHESLVKLIPGAQQHREHQRPPCRAISQFPALQPPA